MRKAHVYVLIVLIALITPQISFSLGIIIPRPPTSPRKVLKTIELKSAAANVVIENDFAETSIKHTFYNPNNEDLEADFYFPIPSGAAITDFRLKMNGKFVSGEVLDKDKAKSTYEDIVRTLKDPALMEWVDYDLFKVRLYPVQKLAEQEIIIDYTAPVPKDQNSYQYILLTKKPTSHTHLSSLKSSPLSVSLSIKDPNPIRNISSPTHKIETTTQEKEYNVSSKIQLGSRNENFIINYEKETKNIHVNFVSSVKNDEEKYFSLTVSPPRKSGGDTLATGNYMFILDTSGSMNEEGKIDQAKKALHYCINLIKKDDRFALINFSTEARTFSKTFASKNEVPNALRWIEDLEARGGTNISAAFEAGFELLTTLDANSSVPATMIFITDGVPTVGTTDSSSLLDLIKTRGKKLNKKTRIFSFGVGTDVNTKLLDQLASDSGAVSDYILPGQNLEVPISRFFDKISHPAITNVKLDIEGLEVYDIYPQILPDIFYGSPLTIFGRYKGSGEFKIKLTGTSPDFTSPLSFSLTSSDNKRRKFIEKLWASRKIGFLLESIKLNGEKEELKKEITMLGKEYDLVTPYTSFLVTEDKEKSSRSRPGTIPTASQAHPTNRFMHSSDSVFSQESGSIAVEASRKIQVLKQTSSLAPSQASEKDTVTDKPQPRFASGRTFFNINNIWIEEGLENSTPDYKITFASPEWFQLRDKVSDLSEILDMSSEVLFKLPSGKTLLITLQTIDSINLNDILK